MKLLELSLSMVISRPSHSVFEAYSQEVIALRVSLQDASIPIATSLLYILCHIVLVLLPRQNAIQAESAIA